MALELELMNAAGKILDVTQVAAAVVEEETPAWLGGVMGMVVVLGALALLWGCCAITGTYFSKSKGKPSLGKTEAAPKAAAPAPVAKVSAAAGGLPLAIIIAAAAQIVGEQVRNVVVRVSGYESETWTAQGRQTIYASHAMKAPAAVGVLGNVRTK